MIVTESGDTISYSDKFSDTKDIVFSLSHNERWYIYKGSKNAYKPRKETVYREVLKVNNVPVAYIELDTIKDMDKALDTCIACKRDNKYRHKGYSSNLVARALEWAKINEDVDCIMWATGKINKSSIGLARKMGFKDSPNHILNPNEETYVKYWIEFKYDVSSSRTMKEFVEGVYNMRDQNIYDEAKFITEDADNIMLENDDFSTSDYVVGGVTLTLLAALGAKSVIGAVKHKKTRKQIEKEAKSRGTEEIFKEINTNKKGFAACMPKIKEVLNKSSNIQIDSGLYDYYKKLPKYYSDATKKIEKSYGITLSKLLQVLDSSQSKGITDSYKSDCEKIKKLADKIKDIKCNVDIPKSTCSGKYVSITSSEVISLLNDVLDVYKIVGITEDNYFSGILKYNIENDQMDSWKLNKVWNNRESESYTCLLADAYNPVIQKFYDLFYDYEVCRWFSEDPFLEILKHIKITNNKTGAVSESTATDIAKIACGVTGSAVKSGLKAARSYLELIGILTAVIAVISIGSKISDDSQKKKSKKLLTEYAKLKGFKSLSDFKIRKIQSITSIMDFCKEKNIPYNDNIQTIEVISDPETDLIAYIYNTDQHRIASDTVKLNGYNFKNNEVKYINAVYYTTKGVWSKELKDTLNDMKTLLKNKQNEKVVKESALTISDQDRREAIYYMVEESEIIDEAKPYIAYLIEKVTNPEYQKDQELINKYKEKIKEAKEALKTAKASQKKFFKIQKANPMAVDKKDLDWFYAIDRTTKGIVNKCDKDVFDAEDRLKALRRQYEDAIHTSTEHQYQFNKSEKARKKAERDQKRHQLTPTMEYVNSVLSLCDCDDIFVESVKAETVYGIPELKKYPLDTKKHVYSAIKLFGHVDHDHEEELARNILSAMKRYDISTDNIGSKNRLSNYI